MAYDCFEIKDELNICDYCRYRETRRDDEEPCCFCIHNAKGR